MTQVVLFWGLIDIPHIIGCSNLPLDFQEFLFSIVNLAESLTLLCFTGGVIGAASSLFVQGRNTDTGD